MSKAAKRLIEAAAGAGGASEVYINNALQTNNTGTNVTYSGNSVNFYVTGADVTFTLKMWGGAGGNGAYSTNGRSGAGGYTTYTFTMSPGTTHYLTVGQGGRGPSSHSYGDGGLGGYPNGGYGTRGDATGAGGGGMSMLSTQQWTGSAISAANIRAIAGGGGGSTGYNSYAGHGGGSSGQNTSTGITGGSQVAGGTYNGAFLFGGNATGQRTGGSDDGGGGGGGYYGGGGGTSDANPGAGGSGYVNTTYGSGSTFGSTGTSVSSGFAPPAANALPSTSYAYAKRDVSGTPQDGYDGIIIVTWTV